MSKRTKAEWACDELKRFDNNPEGFTAWLQVASRSLSSETIELLRELHTRRMLALK